jgi:predicted dehydrogenase
LNLHIVPNRTRLRAAVVGAGTFGRLHMAKYQALPGVELVAIADPSDVSRSAAELKFGVTAHADWRSLKGKIDLVSVCSPASTHAEVVRGFLEAGAHVLVEKPIATNLREADELIALAQARGKVLTVGHQERFVFAGSGLLTLREAPLEIECVRAGPWSGRGTDVSAVLDLMIHDLDLVHRLVPGDIAEVRATGRAVQSAHADEMSAELIFRNGCKVTLVASRIAEARKRSMRLVYKDGAVEFDFLSREMRNTTSRSFKPLDLADPLGAAVGAFVTEVEGGPRTPIRPEEARRALETALMIEVKAAIGVRSRGVQPVGVALSA